MTTAQVEAKYGNSGKGRPRYPVRSMLLALLFMRFEAIPSARARAYLPNVKDPMIDLWVTKRFRVRGDPRLVGLYKLRMTVERSFRAGKLELMMENLRWRGVAKVRMHVAICFACMYAVAITAHRIGRPELANSIAAFTY